MSIHNRAELGQIAETVIMPGDPLRVKYIAEKFLTDAVLVNDVRLALAYTGTWNGKKVTFMASGMGVASAGIYYHELYAFYGVKRIIRIGTCGGLQEDAKLGDVVIASAASNDTGYASILRFPGTFAPVASYPMMRRADDVLTEMKVPHVVAPVFTSIAFYGKDWMNETLRNTGHAAIEMETEALYTEAAINHREALSIVTITDKLATNEHMTSDERERSLDDMIRCSLEI